MNDWIYETAHNISNATKTWLNKTISSAEQRIAEEWEWIVEHLEELSDEARAKWNAFNKWVKDTVEKIKVELKEDWEALKSAAKKTAKILVYIVVKDIQLISAFFTAVGEKTRETFIKANNWIKELARNISREINETAHEIADDIQENWEWIQENIERLSDAAKKKVEEIKQWLKETARQAADAFKRTVRKIKNSAIALKNETVAAWNHVTNYVHDLAVNISREINDTAHAIEKDLEEDWEWVCENFNRLSEAAKKRLTEIKNWIEETAKNVTTAVVDWVHSVVKKIRDEAHKDWDLIVRAIKKLDNKTRETIGELKGWMHDLAQNVSRKAKEAWNKTKKWANETYEKIKDDIERDWEIICDYVEYLDDEAKKNWQAMNEWIRETALLVKEKTEEFAEKVIDAIEGWVEYKKEQIANKTAIFIAASKEAFLRARKWFKKLLFCPLCTNDYVPVCVEADNGEQATFLNACYAKCGELKVVGVGKCKDLEENFAFVVDTDEAEKAKVNAQIAAP